MFIVKIEDQTRAYWLNGTIWTSDKDRAQKFASRSNAEAALDKARKFMKPALFKAARIFPSN